MLERVNEKNLAHEHRAFLDKAGLSNITETEAWTVTGSNTAINYSTHGTYRYFGKFPAPIAANLIRDYTQVGDSIIDPACGSGTSGVEALLSGRDAYLFDVNPLSVLISTVKTRHLTRNALASAITNLEVRMKRVRNTNFTTADIELEHWFLPETIHSLARIRKAIQSEPDNHARDFLWMVFASIVRKVSRATTQQGRLFLDVETAVLDAWPIYLKQANKAADKIAELPKNTIVKVQKKSLLDVPDSNIARVPLVIYHPPYFNAYKYTSINSLEMAWLDFPRKDIRKDEIREFFKVGKPENVDRYIQDMETSLRTCASYIKPGGRVAMMNGDSLMKGVHLPVVAPLVKAVSDVYDLEKVIVRIPKYTEASWASSQRRDKGSLGVTMFDFIVILKGKS
jgi:DNA modification methylase